LAGLKKLGFKTPEGGDKIDQQLANSLSLGYIFLSTVRTIPVHQFGIAVQALPWLASPRHVTGLFCFYHSLSKR
jgi:hypothetical protein